MATDNIIAGTLTVAGLTNVGVTALTGLTTSTGIITTTAGVAAGTALVVGGRAGTNTTTQGITNSVNTPQDFTNLAVTIPAGTVASGRRLRVRWHGEVTVWGSGTLNIQIFIGSTAIVSSGPTVVAANNKFMGEFVLNAPSAAGAAAVCYGWGLSVVPAGAAFVVNQTGNGGQALATNGALVVKATATWNTTASDSTATLDVFSVDIL